MKRLFPSLLVLTLSLVLCYPVCKAQEVNAPEFDKQAYEKIPQSDIEDSEQINKEVPQGNSKKAVNENLNHFLKTLKNIGFWTAETCNSLTNWTINTYNNHILPKSAEIWNLTKTYSVLACNKTKIWNSEKFYAFQEWVKNKTKSAEEL